MTAEPAVQNTKYSPLEVAQKELAPFLKMNPISKIEENEDVTKAAVKISLPWGDTSLTLLVPEDLRSFSEVLNNVYLYG